MSGLSPGEQRGRALLGREAEKARLVALLADARAGQPRSAVIIGEAGIGKSRLLLEVRHRAADEQLEWVVGHAVPYARATPYRALIDALRALFGLTGSETGEDAIAKVDAALEPLGDDARATAPALRWLLGLGAPDATLSVLSGADRKATITYALDVLLRRLSAQAPLVLVFEACQWLDPATEEYLEGAVRRLDAGALLIVMTCRPEESGRTALTIEGERITLRPLDAAEARRMVSALAPEMSADLLTLVAAGRAATRCSSRRSRARSSRPAPRAFRRRSRTC